jgi:hypothetical protein
MGKRNSDRRSVELPVFVLSGRLGLAADALASRRKGNSGVGARERTLAWPSSLSPRVLTTARCWPESPLAQEALVLGRETRR